MENCVAFAGGVTVSHEPHATPEKRLDTLAEATPAASTPPALNRHRKPEPYAEAVIEIGRRLVLTLEPDSLTPSADG